MSKNAKCGGVKYLVFQKSSRPSGFIGTAGISQDDILSSLIHNILKEHLHVCHIFTFHFWCDLNHCRRVLGNIVF